MYHILLLRGESREVISAIGGPIRLILEAERQIDTMRDKCKAAERVEDFVGFKIKSMGEDLIFCVVDELSGPVRIEEDN